MERNYQMLILVGIIGLVSVLFITFSKEIGNFFGDLWGGSSQNWGFNIFTTWAFSDWIYGIVFVVFIIIYMIRKIGSKRR